jgi:hypothetical protein
MLLVALSLGWYSGDDDVNNNSIKFFIIYGPSQ